MLYGRTALPFSHVATSRFKKWGSSIANGRVPIDIKTRGLITRYVDVRRGKRGFVNFPRCGIPFRRFGSRKSTGFERKRASVRRFIARSVPLARDPVCRCLEGLFSWLIIFKLAPSHPASSDATWLRSSTHSYLHIMSLLYWQRRPLARQKTHIFPLIYSH